MFKIGRDEFKTLIDSSFRFKFEIKLKVWLTSAVEDGDVLGGQRRLALDADQQRRAATGGHALTGEVDGLEAQGESALLVNEKKYISGCYCE